MNRMPMVNTFQQVRFLISKFLTLFRIFRIKELRKEFSGLTLITGRFGAVNPVKQCSMSNAY